MKPTALDVLKLARKLVRKGWTQNTSARTAQGFRCDYLASDATHFCLSGAMHAAASKLHLHVPPIRVPCYGNDWPSWNDEEGRTQAEVLALLDSEIERMSKR